MSNISNSRHITNQQENSIDWLLDLHPTVRFALGLFSSALGGWYVPHLILIFTTGIWAGTLSMWLVNAIAIGMLMTINLIGNKLNHILLAGAVCALLLGCYQARQLAMTTSWQAWESWIPQMLVPLSLPLLNAYFLVRYKRLAQLDDKK